MRSGANLGDRWAAAAEWIERRGGWIAGALVALLWLPLIAGYDAIPWDGTMQFLPSFTLIGEAARGGGLRFWDPWVAGGWPISADPQHGVFSPVVVALGALSGGAEWGLRLYVALLWVAMTSGWHLLGRSRSREATSCCARWRSSRASIDSRCAIARREPPGRPRSPGRCSRRSGRPRSRRAAGRPGPEQAERAAGTWHLAPAPEQSAGTCGGTCSNGPTIGWHLRGTFGSYS